MLGNEELIIKLALVMGFSMQRAQIIDRGLAQLELLPHHSAAVVATGLGVKKKHVWVADRWGDGRVGGTGGQVTMGTDGAEGRVVPWAVPNVSSSRMLSW